MDDAWTFRAKNHNKAEVIFRPDTYGQLLSIIRVNQEALHALEVARKRKKFTVRTGESVQKVQENNYTNSCVWIPGR